MKVNTPSERRAGRSSSSESFHVPVMPVHLLRIDLVLPPTMEAELLLKLQTSLFGLGSRSVVL